MLEHDGGGVKFFSFKLFESIHNLTSVVTTRLGGESEAAYEALNLALHVGDDPDRVLENRARVAQVLGFEPEWFTVGQQVHGAEVANVERSDRGRGAVVETDALAGVDALITRAHDTPLMVLVADCVALCLYDPARAAIGLAHAGWKGTLARVAERTIEAMSRSFGTEPGDVMAAIAPSIGRGHYEVGQDVFDAYVDGFGRKTAQVFLQEDMDGTCYLDLWSANEFQLRAAGLKPENIAVTEMCTACHPDLFFSHRMENGQTGRFAAVMMLHAGMDRPY